MKFNKLIFFSLFLFLIPFLVFAQCDEATKPSPPDCPPKTFTETINQNITQYRCTKGACGGKIEFWKREGERNCERNCTTNYQGIVECVDDHWATSCVETGTTCTNWSCENWEFKNETLTNTYDTKDNPWLVCTYRYDKLTDEEKVRAHITYPYQKIICNENNCPEVDEVSWFPPVYNSDSKEYFEEKVENRSFFDATQVTCWGRCLDMASGPHYFGGSINPTRKVKWYDGSEHIESEEQDPNGVRLPVKFGWELDMKKNGMNEWEEAIDWARAKCKEGLEKGIGCNYPPLYDENDAREILKKIYGENKFKVPVDNDLYLPRGLGAGSFYFKQPVAKFLPLAEGQKIPEWQTPGSGKGDVYWTRKDMFDYFDYYFLSKTGYSGNEVRYGFSGEIEGRRLFVYSPSQDSKKDFLWVEYKDPNENSLTKQLRSDKIGGTNGPCSITPFQNHSFFVTPCCSSDSENCSPQKPNWKFYALGPEIKSILGIRIEERKIVYPFHLGSIPKEEGKIYRFIDVDWDRTWPSKLKREELLKQQGDKYDYFYTGMVNFDRYDGGLSDCKETCKKNCDSKCLDLCEEQCKEECESSVPKEGVESCKEECHKKFEKFREGCPDCKAEEKKMGCVTCEKCSKCTEDCEKNCKDCQEICGQRPDLDLVAARGECNKLSSAKDREICNICQNCLYKADYVDIEWCSNFSGTPLLAPLYKAREDINFPLESFSQRIQSQECEDIHTPSPCKQNPCQCYKYNKGDGSEILEHDGCSIKIQDFFLPYPKVRMPKEALEKMGSKTFKCALYSYEYKEGENCLGMEPLQTFDRYEDSKLVGTLRTKFEKLRIVRDAYVEFGNLGKKLTYSIPISLTDTPWTPQPWWERDKNDLLFASFVSNGVVVGVENMGSGLRWDFRMETLPKFQFCDYQKENCFGEAEKEYPFCWEIKKDSLRGYLTPEKEFDEKKKEFVIYRVEEIKLPFTDRILSFRLKIKSGGSFLEYLPKISTQSPLFSFPVWGFWNALPPFGDALGRLVKEFSFYFFPCGDEMGFFCLTNYIQQKIRTTGEPPPVPFEEEASGPPPPKKIRIPHYFNWDGSFGAASYWLKFEEKGGGEMKEFFHPDVYQTAILKSNMWVDGLKENIPYLWQVKTCADLCSKDSNYLQCGNWSEKIGPVVGYYLYPPTEMLTVSQFFPDEEITLWWKPIATGTDCTHLKITYQGGMFEKRKDCIEKALSTLEGYIVLDEIKKGDLNGKFTIPKELLPTSTEIFEDKTTGIKTNICLGDYYYQIRYCTGEDCYKKKEDCKKPEDCKKGGGNYLDCVDCYYSAECQEAGDWSHLALFEIVTRKYGGGVGGGGGFGTCKNIIPCTKCTFSDIPKIISNILNCILWTLSPIAMVILLLYTGVRIYFSFGSSEVIERVKSIWKAVGIGWLVMLLSWTIVNLIGKTFKLPGW